MTLNLFANTGHPSLCLFAIAGHMSLGVFAIAIGGDEDLRFLGGDEDLRFLGGDEDLWDKDLRFLILGGGGECLLFLGEELGE